eukprot:g36888.t1
MFGFIVIGRVTRDDAIVSFVGRTGICDGGGDGVRRVEWSDVLWLLWGSGLLDQMYRIPTLEPQEEFKSSAADSKNYFNDHGNLCQVLVHAFFEALQKAVQKAGRAFLM